MSKYIDLEPKVSDYYGTSPGQERRAGICDALRYLDSHTDQVPGRTITESKFQESLEETFGSKYEYTGRAFLEDLGIPIVPDPEPTNAELIERKLRELREEPGEWMTYATDSDISGFSQVLDAKGVKAPDHD